METEKTIRMPKKLLEGWLRALRSGEYRQGYGELEVAYDNGPRYCCLGVLQMVADGKTEGVRGCTTPTREWLEVYDVEFRGAVADYRTSTCDPFLPALGVFASTANDRERKTFAEIADAIEACAEGV